MRVTRCSNTAPTLVLLTLAILVAPTPAAADRAQEATKRPNVLILQADDWRWDTLGCAGNPVVKTPNIDALAAEGVRFSHASVTTAICGISRACLLTGQWMSRHGCRDFGPFQTPWAETYPGRLRAAGYWTGHVGKWHNGRFPAEHYDYGIAYSGAHFVKRPDGSTVHVTKKNEEDALRFLRERPKDRPFVLTVAFFAAHAEDLNPKQYRYQPESDSLYRDVSIPIPKTATDAAFRRLPPFLANEKNEGRNRWHWRFDTPEKYQDYMKAYYRLATEVDATVGRIVGQLRDEDLLEKTLVIFTGDNGYFHGEHGLADKWYPYEEAIRVPLIVRDPRLPKSRRGTVNDALVLNVDIAPTLLHYTGVDAPGRIQGQDFAPLYLTDRPPAWRDEFYYEHPVVLNAAFIPSSEAVVRKEAKYLNWPDFAYEQYFDLARDPFEERDLAHDPAQTPDLAAWRAKLAAWRERVK